MTLNTMSSLPEPVTAEEIEEWLTGSMKGKPEEAHSFCERYLSPKFFRQMAHGDDTDFESAVEKVARFRSTCEKWESPVRMVVQQGNQIAARLDVKMKMQDQSLFEGELMFMGTRDEQGRYEKLWELTTPLAK